jgi:hypothetical protein
MINADEYGVIGEIIRKSNRIILREPAPVPFYPPQIPYDLTRAPIRSAAVGSRLNSLSYCTTVPEVKV